MTPLSAGDELDCYRIESLAAYGGMASIFRAIDMRDGSTVAIKVPYPEAECDPVFFDRFQREIAIGQKLDHPGTVKTRNTAGASRLYMVMEWADGRLLRHVLAEEGRLPVERSLRIALAICEAPRPHPRPRRDPSRSQAREHPA
jgi:serine/threonine-protein kinase